MPAICSRAYLRFIPVFCIFCLLPCCADKPEEKPKEKAEDPTKAKLVGRVASIPADRKFVLIQAYGNWEVETGSILTTQGPEGRAANLRATGEKLGQYAAADIQSGTLEIGDGVYTVAQLSKSSLTTSTSILASDEEIETTDEDPGPEAKPSSEPSH
ncbi:hypothetical protein ACFSSA_12040 [Luteolibacter algae]|uniref:DUF5666 domain-containing protein n=1 Tax=Luteolibacter algae TaxID=454151 RepID=A0ABW5DA04_9BACT